MTKSKKLRTQLRAEKTSVLSPEILARVDKIAKDKRQSIDFLKKGGFLDQKGKLAPKYRLPSSR